MEKDRGSYYNQEKWLEEFLENKGGFSNGSGSDDSDNDGEIHNENSSSCLRVLPIITTK